MLRQFRHSLTTGRMLDIVDVACCLSGDRETFFPLQAFGFRGIAYPPSFVAAEIYLARSGWIGLTKSRSH